MSPLSEMKGGDSVSKKTRRVFYREFKIEAVQLATVGDRTVST